VIVIVHGYEGSGPRHWQRWLEAELGRLGVPTFFPALPNPLTPRRDEWVATLADTIEAGTRATTSAADRRITFVCHSLGCWALDHLLAQRSVDGAHAALLVAPPSPLLLFEPADSFFPPPMRTEAWEPIADRTLVVGSDTDAYTAPDEFLSIGDDLGVEAMIIPDAGHINVDSGHGPWPFVLEWLESVDALER
jgi:predicted alpha/beta hydrolase family esterase